MTDLPYDPADPVAKPLCAICGQPAIGIAQVNQGDPEFAFCGQHRPPPLPVRSDDTPGYAAFRTWQVG